MKVVINTSPIISLVKIGIFDLCLPIFEDIIITEAVKDELIEGKDKATEWIESKGKKYIRTVTEINNIISTWDLGKGESEVLSFAKHNNDYIAGIDDKAARNCAEAISIPVIGTIGILLHAKKSGIVSAIKPKIIELKEEGFRIDNNIIQYALLLANEN